MRELCMLVLLASTLLYQVVPAAVDTLKGTSDMEDCNLYSWEDCNAEIYEEDCRRYNAGLIQKFGTGVTGLFQERRTLFGLPGWNDILPDSSEFKVYCDYEEDTNDRKIFLYPLTRQFFEGSENAYNIGDYPDPDSGATWLHAYLDVGDGDSVLWTNAGGDYITDVACTTIITDTGQYFAFKNFNRILNYWDTSGTNYGFILINENAFPGNSSIKVIWSSEAASSVYPLVILYTTGDAVSRRRARLITTVLGD